VCSSDLISKIIARANKETFFNFKTNTPFQQRQAESR